MITYHLSSSIGTHVAGTVAGNDPSATIGEGAVYDGVAPDAKIAFTDMAEGNSQGLGVRSIAVMTSRMPYDDGDEYTNLCLCFLLLSIHILLIFHLHLHLHSLAIPTLL